jgi:hypothetical protein
MIQFKKQLVTPELAKVYLSTNKQNRNVKERKLLRFAHDIMLDKWKEDTGETMKFSKCGRLIDGQHRLLAIIKANKAIYLHISEGHDYSIFDVLDTGTSRSVSDAFNIAGVKMANTIPSIIVTYNWLKNGSMTARVINPTSSNQILEQYNLDVEHWNNMAKSAHNLYLYINKIVAPSTIGGTYAYLFDINAVKANLFFNQLCSGYGIENDSITLLRNQLTKDKLSMYKMSTQMKFAFIIKTWNAYVSNKTIKQLKFNPDLEPFPTPLAI